MRLRCLTSKPRKEVNILRNDIDKYYEEQSTKFIVGALSFDKWGEFNPRSRR